MLIEKLAHGLGLTAKYVENRARSASHAYKRYAIKKRSGGFRYIDHPAKELKSMQRWLLHDVLEIFPIHPAAMAYRRGVSVFDNARAHSKSKYLLRMDFKDFFPSLTVDDFRAYKVSRRHLFADWTPEDFKTVSLLLFKDSKLTIGAPTSPAISNILCFDMDEAIQHACDQQGVKYTRYADDLFFSAVEANTLGSIETEVARLVGDLALPKGLQINPHKTRHSSRRGARRVTGVVIGSDRKAHVGRALKRKIRTLIHTVDNLKPTERAQLSGLLGYVAGFDRGFLNSLVIKYGSEKVQKAIHPSL